MNFLEPDPVEKKTNDPGSTVSCLNLDDYLFSQRHSVNSKLSQNKKRQKFAALSLNKCDKAVNNVDISIKQTSSDTKAIKRTCDTKEYKPVDKKCKLEENLFEDTLFDDINLTQILQNNNEVNTKNTRPIETNVSHPQSAIKDKTFNHFQSSLKNATINTQDMVPHHSKSDHLPSAESTPKSKLNDSSQNKKLPLSQLSQLFENSQVMNQIESILSEENESCNTSRLKLSNNTCDRLLKDKKLSENLGDIFTDNNRGEIESFFNQIEHSVSMMGTADVENTNENVTKILEMLFSTQANSSCINKLHETITNETDVTLSGINASFASALNQVFLANASKKLLPPKISETATEAQSSKFTEAGPFYGLPLRVKELIKLYKGIEELYDWQDECLQLPAIKERKNLIYALPTSGGKTLVAEILMLREIICYKRNALFVLPYVAIVQEKVWALSPFAVALDFLVEEYAAGKGGYPPRKRRRKNSIYVATIEKALGLLNSLIENGRISELGLIVVDELHLVGEQSRGCTLEALLSKIMFIKADVQIVGMSATIGNVTELCTFLNAEIYTQNFRPVELVEYVKCGSEIAKINYSKREEELLTVVRTVDNHPKGVSSIDPDKLGSLVMEVIPEGSCLIFCASKKNCENVANLLCRVLNKSLINHKKEEKEQVKHALKDEGGSLCHIFSVSIQLGVAYHHSGLTNEERRVIEEAFRAGVISVICCTSTLAAGVNLPAKRVILRQPYVGKEFINLSKYKQMVGRAGRAGLGETGDSILICTNIDLPKVRKLLMSPMDEALSSLHEAQGKGLRHLLLSCISLGIANTRSQLQEVSKTTLLSIQSERLGVNLKKLTDKVIGDLFKLGALQEADLTKSESNLRCDVTVRLESSFGSSSFSELTGQVSTGKKRKILLKNDTKLVISKLGCAAIKGNFELTRAHQLYDDLHEAQKSLVLLDSLHLLYLVTPYDLAEQIRPNKNVYYNMYCKLGTNELQTARILGLDDSVALKMLSNQQIKNVPERVLNRFYLTMMLHDLWNENPVFEVSEKYQINRGIVQHLMSGSATFASNVVHFCEGLEEFWSFAFLLKGMSERLSHCCVRELLPLMELPAVKQSRAKQLYNAGYKSVRSIAATNAETLVECIEHLPKRVAKQLIAAAKMLLLEKVENLREEAEDVLDGVETKAFLNHSLLH